MSGTGPRPCPGHVTPKGRQGASCLRPGWPFPHSSPQGQCALATLQGGPSHRPVKATEPRVRTSGVATTFPKGSRDRPRPSRMLRRLLGVQKWWVGTAHPPWPVLYWVHLEWMDGFSTSGVQPPASSFRSLPKGEMTSTCFLPTTASSVQMQVHTPTHGPVCFLSPSMFSRSTHAVGYRQDFILLWPNIPPHGNGAAY